MCTIDAETKCPLLLALSLHYSTLVYLAVLVER